MGKKCGIYCIENTINHKKYIGQSVDISTRWSNHRYKLNKNIHNNLYLQNAWNKYSADVFTFTIIEECDESNLIERERYYIEYYDSTADAQGYNLTHGGELPPLVGNMVIDYRTGETYPSASSAARSLQVNKATMYSWCREHRNCMYYKDWQALSEAEREQIRAFDWSAATFSRRSAARSMKNATSEERRIFREKRIQKGQSFIVYSPELDEYFLGPIEAQEKYGVSRDSISLYLQGKLKSAGKHPITGKPLTWVKIVKE